MQLQRVAGAVVVLPVLLADPAVSVPQHKLGMSCVRGALGWGL